MLSGYKTYIVAALAVVLAGAELFGIQVPGVSATPGDLILYALGLFGLRNAIPAKV